MSDLSSIHGSITLPGDQRSAAARELTDVLRVCLSAGEIGDGLARLRRDPLRSKASAEVEALDDQWSGDVLAASVLSHVRRAHFALAGIANAIWLSDSPLVGRLGLTGRNFLALYPALVLTSFESSVAGIWLLSSGIDAHTRMARTHMEHVNDFVSYSQSGGELAAQTQEAHASYRAKFDQRYGPASRVWGPDGKHLDELDGEPFANLEQRVCAAAELFGSDTEWVGAHEVLEDRTREAVATFGSHAVSQVHMRRTSRTNEIGQFFRDRAPKNWATTSAIAHGVWPAAFAYTHLLTSYIDYFVPQSCHDDAPRIADEWSELMSAAWPR